MQLTKKTGALYKLVRYHISSLAFITGFLWDAITLNRIDLLYENIVFTSYLLIAFVGILLIHGVETKRWTQSILVRARPWLPAMVQFPLGGLFSGFLIFYTKSASFFTSWPFVLILFLLLFGNEFLRRRYERLVFQLSFFYFALICYAVLITPLVLGTISTSSFMLSLVLSVAIMAILVRIIVRLFPEVYTRSVKALYLSLGSILCVFTFMYYTNAIPPVPLTLQEIGIYHDVKKNGDRYDVLYEEAPWYAFWRDTHAVYHQTQYEAAYCFAAVFAPGRITAKVSHSWQRKDEEGHWKREANIPYVMKPGRNGGYRGYTIKNNLPTGEWRCVVETEDKKTIGEVRFKVVGVQTARPQVEGVR